MLGRDLTARYGIRHRAVQVDLSEPDDASNVVDATDASTSPPSCPTPAT
jgi:hypothetical protein